MGSPESYAKAGEMGAGILTNLIVQDTSQLREGIKIYKEALKNNGFSEEHAKVTVLLHTFVGENKNEVIEIARQPLYNYLSSSMQLFQKTHADQENAANLDRLSDEDKEFVFSRAYARYVKGHALIGDVSSCLPTLNNLSEIGVTEFAAFIDFGVDPDLVFANLKKINELKARFGDQYKDSDSNQDSPMKIKTDEYQRYTWSQSQVLCPQVRIDLQGNFDEVNFVKALNQVAQRHETLRTVFSGDGTEQIIQSTPLIEFISHAFHASKVVHTLEKIDECLLKIETLLFTSRKGRYLEPQS